MWRQVRKLIHWGSGTALAGLAALVWLSPIVSLADITRQLWPVSVLMALTLTALVWLPVPQPRSFRPRSRSASRIIAAVLLILVLLPALTPTWAMLRFRANETPPSPAFTLTLVTHNLWGHYYDTEAARDVMLTSGADIIALQEAWNIERLERAGFRRAYPFATECSASTRIYARRAPLDTGCIRHGPATDWQNASPCQLDLPPASWARFAGPEGGVIHVVSVHMDWPNPFGVQDCERRNLAGHLARFPQDTLIIAGDFNAADPSRALARFGEDFGLARLTHGLPTWPAEGRFGTDASGVTTPLIGIDHVFAGEAVELLGRDRLASTGSDHRPVRVRLRIQPSSGGPEA